MKRHIFGGICQVLFRKKWGDFNYEQRKSLEKSRLRIPRRYSIRWGDVSHLLKNENLLGRELVIYKTSDKERYVIDIE